ncbi:hypothetical protein [Methylobacterium soli]|uniref:DUF1579 domain-containing protein n=1 Tax=Methylobacterium soli TaxID=553447 RepID=A0A6L3SRB3_9HYPH|nr:hypothetical protein [Methylobacterium soli]KAB1070999.1 hypothetical protein F6X53_29375 [Methylobacterium soli]GJE44920.1 hypothetical protein AEGHOMDF_4113 [Methylobacterium soli]
MDGIKDKLRGKWRITEASTWDNDYLDLVEPAFIAFDQLDIGSEFRFGVVVASLDCAYSQTDVEFNFHGSDEGTEVWGDGWAELDGPEVIYGEIAFHNGDETTFKARRW